MRLRPCNIRDRVDFSLAPSIIPLIGVFAWPTRKLFCQIQSSNGEGQATGLCNPVVSAVISIASVILFFCCVGAIVYVKKNEAQNIDPERVSIKSGENYPPLHLRALQKV